MSSTSTVVTTSATASSSTATREDLDAAKADVRKCEDEIESIKVALRRFAAFGPDDFQANQLDIVMLKWQGLPVELAPTPAVTLQLSSPVEEIRLEQLWDPLAPTTTTSSSSSSSDLTPSAPKSLTVASFAGVETSMATLTVTAHANPLSSGASSANNGMSISTTTTISSSLEHDILGSSEPIDVSLLCPLDAMNPQESYLTEWPITITKSDNYTTTTSNTSAAASAATPTEDTTSAAPSESTTAKEDIEPAKAEPASGTDEEEPTIETKEEATSETPTSVDDAAASTTTADETVQATSTTETAQAITTTETTTLGTVTLRVTYKPSAKDQQEALYELLNKASQRKNVALDHLRQVSFQLSQSGPADSKTSSSANNSKPTIKPGFLNSKIKKQQQPSFWSRWYQKALSVQSFVQFAYPIAHNYIIFFAAVVVFHYHGQYLALPPPI